MKDFIETLKEESEKLGILQPRFFRYEKTLGFITGFYHGKGEPIEMDPNNPKGSIGAFAQMNYYRILVETLKALLRCLESTGRLSKGTGRIYCNSRFPEKSFATASGFGMRGKNSLVIVPSFGTFLVLGGVLFWDTPIPTGTTGSERRLFPEAELLSGEGEFPLCGSCRACQEACPTGALDQPGILDTSRCLQAYASHLCSVPEGISEKWGALFYGCDVCQEVCPHNKLHQRTNVKNPPEICFSGSGPGRPLHGFPHPDKWGYLGRGLELGKVLETPDEQLRKGIFRHSVLDISWIPPHALKRNALLALTHQAVSSNWVTSRWHLLMEYGKSPDPILRSTAKYTMKKIKNKVKSI